MVRQGKTLLSGVDPEGRAEKIVNAIAIKERTLYFCPSVLYGYGLVRLLSRIETEAPSSAVLCVEADCGLFELSKTSVDSSVLTDKKLHITNITDIEKLCEIIKSRWGAKAFRRVETIRLTGGFQLFPELYDSIREKIRSEIASEWSNALTLNKLGRLFFRNMLRNLPLTLNFRSIDNLNFGSLPVLVLGAGPSLDDFFEKWTPEKKTERGFKVICVDTCLGALKDRGITPDLVVILESQHWNLRDFIGCKGWNVPAAADLSSAPASSRLLTGETFLFMTSWTNLRVFERLIKDDLLPAFFPPLGSVGLTAVEIARRLTSGKIICAGLDFSFTADKYHARSTPGHRSKLNTQNRFKGILNTVSYDVYSAPVVSKSGCFVYSNPSMKNYRSLFEQEFGGDPRIFSIEDSGLSLGVKTLSPEKAFSVLIDEEFNRELAQTGTKEHYNIEEQVSEVSCKNLQLLSFFESEKKRLLELRDILTGEGKTNSERFFILLEECDYLWGHLPDYSLGRAPDSSDISFLKRIRAEIDPMLKLLENIARIN